MKAMAFTRWTTLRGRLTAGQLAFDSVAFDGVEPADLEGEVRERARLIFGPTVEYIPPAARRVVVQVKGRGIGGTQSAAEQVARLGATISLDGLDPAEIPFVFFGGPKIRHGRVGLRFARTVLLRHNARIIDDSKDGFTLVRGDGRHVRFECFAASRGGDNTRGVHVIAAVLTEASFYFDESSGAHNGESIFAAIIPRLLAGGQIIIESTPWAESGLLHSEFVANWGNPTRALAGLCPTPLMRDDPETLRMVEQERERDPENARRELDAEFMPTGSGHYFDHYAVGRCASESLPLVILPPHTGWSIGAGYDPAYVRDAAEGVIVRSNGVKYEVVDVYTRVPTKGTPLVPSEVDAAFAALVRKHGGTTIATDMHYRESVRENIKDSGVTLANVPQGNAGKTEVFAKARELMNADLLRWSSGHRRLTRQASEIIAKPLSGGMISISSPRRRGDHGDAIHALTLACFAVSRRRVDISEWVV